MRQNTSELDVALERVLNGATAADCESPTLDFKEDKSSVGDTERMIAEAAICFSNSAGGIIALGVRDKSKGANALVGTSHVPQRIKQRIYELSRPHLNVESYYHSKYQNIVVIEVPQSSEIHSDTQGRATQRINLDCVPLTPDQLVRLREERRGVDWSSERSGRFAKEISDDVIVKAKSILVRFNDERRKLANLGKSDLLNALGVIKRNGELTRAGALLFCNFPDGEPFNMTYQYRSTPGGEPKVIQRLTPPYITLFASAMELIAARRVTTPLNLPNGQQVLIEDFPSLAVREGISNAICHRDYHLDGSVILDHSPEVFVITSPGPLVSGVTINNIITTTSRPRNPALAKAARILGFAEELGRGIDRMYREMIRSGKNGPSIENSFDRVRVALVGGAPDTNIAKFVASLPEAEQEDTDTMIVLLRLCSSKTVSASSVATFLQKSAQESESVLRRLASEEVAIVERTRATYGRALGVYRLRSESLKKLGVAVTYQRRTSDEIDKKVIAHVREYGRITNRTLQNFFDIHVFKARDIISDLVQRNILERISKVAKGPNVEWGPGQSFPAKKVRHKSQNTAKTNNFPLFGKMEDE